MKRIAIFPGSFDPFTKGHEDVVLRGRAIFDEVIIGIGHNSQKKRFFDIDLMIAKMNAAFQNVPGISVITYDELTAELAKKLGAKFLLRGLRNTTDFEYENTIAQINRHVNQELETVFLITSPQYAYISSTVIREIHKYGHSIDNFLPYTIDDNEQGLTP